MSFQSQIRAYRIVLQNLSFLSKVHILLNIGVCAYQFCMGVSLLGITPCDGECRVLGFSYLIFSVALILFGFAGSIMESQIDVAAYVMVALVNWAQTMWRAWNLQDSRDPNQTYAAMGLGCLAMLAAVVPSIFLYKVVKNRSRFAFLKIGSDMAMKRLYKKRMMFYCFTKVDVLFLVVLFVNQASFSFGAGFEYLPDCKCGIDSQPSYPEYFVGGWAAIVAAAVISKIFYVHLIQNENKLMFKLLPFDIVTPALSAALFVLRGLKCCDVPYIITFLAAIFFRIVYIRINWICAQTFGQGLKQKLEEMERQTVEGIADAEAAIRLDKMETEIKERSKPEVPGGYMGLSAEVEAFGGPVEIIEHVGKMKGFLMLDASFISLYYDLSCKNLKFECPFKSCMVITGVGISSMDKSLDPQTTISIQVADTEDSIVVFSSQAVCEQALEFLEVRGTYFVGRSVVQTARRGTIHKANSVCPLCDKLIHKPSDGTWRKGMGAVHIHCVSDDGMGNSVSGRSDRTGAVRGSQKDARSALGGTTVIGGGVEIDIETDGEEVGTDSMLLDTDGTCSICKLAIPAQTRARWKRGRGIMHLSCNEASSSPPAAAAAPTETHIYETASLTDPASTSPQSVSALPTENHQMQETQKETAAASEDLADRAKRAIFSFFGSSAEPEKEMEAGHDLESGSGEEGSEYGSDGEEEEEEEGERTYTKDTPLPQDAMC